MRLEGKGTLFLVVAALLLWAAPPADAKQCRRTITRGCKSGQKRVCTAQTRQALKLTNPTRYKQARKNYAACVKKKSKHECLNKLRSLTRSLLQRSGPAYCQKKWTCGPCK